MPREKLQRELNLKFRCKYFGPKDNESFEDIVLLHEEIEAIQLMDLLHMYQEDAAKKMHISRPTFARIIKSARKKIALALVSGMNLKIHENKNDFNIAICSNKKDELEDISISSAYILIFQIKDYKLKSQMLINNPIYTDNFKPSVILPNLLVEHDINYFITNKIGVGLKNSLITKGIYPILKDTLSISKIIEVFT